VLRFILDLIDWIWYYTKQYILPISGWLIIGIVVGKFLLK